MTESSPSVTQSSSSGAQSPPSPLYQVPGKLARVHLGAVQAIRLQDNEQFTGTTHTLVFVLPATMIKTHYADKGQAVSAYRHVDAAWHAFHGLKLEPSTWECPPAAGDEDDAEDSRDGNPSIGDGGDDAGPE